MNNEKNNESKKSNNSVAIENFSETVAGYFMDFLETDFKRRRKPKRQVKNHKDGLKTGIRNQKYSRFSHDVRNLLKDGFSQTENLDFIEKGVYTKELPENLINFIENKIEGIQQEEVDAYIKQIVEIIEERVASYPRNIEKVQDKVFEKAHPLATRKIVTPLTDELEEPISESNLGDESTIYLLQEELTELLVSEVKPQIKIEIENIFGSDEPIDKQGLQNSLGEEIQLDELKAEYKNFFSDFSVTDLYRDVVEMKRSKDVLEKHEFYFYFGDIRYDNSKYPLFYLPITLEKTQGDSGQSEGFRINYGGKLYFNKKAVEYVVQEYKNDKDISGTPDISKERIIYIAEHQDELSSYLNEILEELTEFFALESGIDFSDSTNQVADSLLVKMTNQTYLSLFDKADESLINDYEKILQSLKEGGEEGVIFSDLIDHFLNEDPESYTEEIEDEWEDNSIGEKLVYSSPIPLNEEQRKILSAVKKDGCNHITVQGPPGTGKSHTITAVVFDAILNDKSTLVLSDKKEALDVVERKITDTLEQTRTSSDFQDPVLRLGDAGNNLHKILSSTSTDSIKNAYQAARQNVEDLPDTIEGLENTIEQSIEAEVREGESINMQAVHKCLDLDAYFENREVPMDIEELTEEGDSLSHLESLIESIKYTDTLLLDIQDRWGEMLVKELSLDVSDIDQNAVELIEECGFQLQRILEQIDDVYEDVENIWGHFEYFNREKLEELKKITNELESLKSPLFGYLFSREKVAQINTDFRKEFPKSAIKEPSQKVGLLNDCIEITEYAIELIEDKKEEAEHRNFLSLELLHKASNSPEYFEELVDTTAKLLSEMQNVEEFANTYPKTTKELNIDPKSAGGIIDNKLEELPESERGKIMEYIKLKSELDRKFSNIGGARFTEQKNKLEALSTLRMSFEMDKRFVDFYENNRNTANQLRDIIKDKRQFPKDKFESLKKAFPCILASIRDYSEYIPLETETFDLVVIDEASQVSIAQALPALLRAETVLILGDEQQFSNVKSSQAKKEINQEYKNRLRNSLIEDVEQNDATVESAAKYFDVKKSVLDFFDFINNYEVLLKKHFRGYKEIISFSNRFFYNQALEVMKVRAKPIDKVLKFTQIEHDSKKEIAKNTNMLEVNKIISDLEELADSNKRPSVGVITPFRNQQKLINKKAREHPKEETFFNELDLKVMTFDSCQGEERDIVYYSMVANPEEDKLSHIFPANLKEESEANSKREQRLNVGFSRAKEQMHFVCSKPLGEFNGTSKRVLSHYKTVKERAKEEKSVEEVDEKSPMEEKVLEWFYQTSFWKEYTEAERKAEEEGNEFTENLEIKPQFDLGSYLKQLDPHYQHPEYTVDFLLVYEDEQHTTHNIIIEYDGFKEHFTDLEAANKFNHEQYYKESDVYRQKVLEGYGYQFLRINKFNVGYNPVEKLDSRIKDLIEQGNEITASEVQDVQEDLQRVEEGSGKICSTCGKIRKKEEFRDESLKTNYGRKCVYCKGIKRESESRDAGRSSTASEEAPVCDDCGGKMQIRNGRHGKFYGCSRYPKCKNTKDIN